MWKQTKESFSASWVSVLLLPPYGGLEKCNTKLKLQFCAVQYGLVLACPLGDGVCSESALAGLPLDVLAQAGSA